MYVCIYVCVHMYVVICRPRATQIDTLMIVSIDRVLTLNVTHRTTHCKWSLKE